MTTRKIATQLSEQGRRALAEFLANNLSDKVLKHLLSAWEGDITFGANESTAGHLEIGQFYTKTKNPVVYIFEGDEVELEDVEEDED